MNAGHEGVTEQTCSVVDTLGVAAIAERHRHLGS